MAPGAAAPSAAPSGRRDQLWHRDARGAAEQRVAAEPGAGGDVPWKDVETWRIWGELPELLSPFWCYEWWLVGFCVGIWGDFGWAKVLNPMNDVFSMFFRRCIVQVYSGKFEFVVGLFHWVRYGWFSAHVPETC